MNPSLNLKQTWALRYLRAGLSVIPCHPQTKIPSLKWEKFQNRRAAENEVLEWFKSGQENIGVVTGQLSNLAVIDADGTLGISAAVQHGLYSPVTVLSGRGKHLWFQYPKEGITNSASKIAPGIDVRGEGGVVIAPPSLHENGKKYRFQNGFAGIGRLPLFPKKLMTKTDAILETSNTTNSDAWLNEAINDLRNGHTHNNLVSILGRLRHDGLPDSVVFNGLRESAIAGGMAEDELKSKIAEIWDRYESGQNTVSLSGVPTICDRVIIHSPSNDSDFIEFERVRLGTQNREDSSCLKSGFPSLDRMLEGGLKSERPFVCAALANHGKTNFGIALAANLIRQGKKVVYFSTEYRYTKIWSRYEAYQDLRQYPIHVCDAFAPNPEQVEEVVRQTSPDVFIFDYIQHISKDKETLTGFIRHMQLIQRKCGCQAIILAQLNRNADWVEDGKRILPRMSMIEGSASIEQGASRVLLLSEDKVTPEINEITAVLDKNDSGEKGMFKLALRKNPYRVEELPC